MYIPVCGTGLTPPDLECASPDASSLSSSPSSASTSSDFTSLLTSAEIARVLQNITSTESNHGVFLEQENFKTNSASYKSTLKCARVLNLYIRIKRKTRICIVINYKNVCNISKW